MGSANQPLWRRTMALDHDTTSQVAAHEVLLNDPAFLQELVRAVLQRFLAAEMAEHLRAEPHERSEERRGHRNGYKARQVVTRAGTLRLIARQARAGPVETESLARYPRD